MSSRLEEINKHLEEALSLYSNEDNYKFLLHAKEEYFSYTGRVQEEDVDFEARMNSFNEWYLLNYKFVDSSTVINNYFESNETQEELTSFFKNITFSLFDYTGKNWQGHHVLKDILHDKKVKVHKDQENLPILKGEIFIGRVVSDNDKNFLLNGVNPLPQEIKAILKKQAKIVRKLNSPEEEEKFLLQVEALKTKWTRYGHVDPEKIFRFT